MSVHFSKTHFRQTALAIGIALFSFNAVASGSHQYGASLDSALANNDAKSKERYQYRHPKQTLKFFGIKPGMKVIEVLPGNKGWYSKILLPYIGEKGELVGVDYPLALWNNFSFMTPERLEAKKTWVSTWTKETNERKPDHSASVSAFQFDDMPSSVAGTADAVLFIRALHNLKRFNDKGGYLDTALKETFIALKPGGVVGVVQHQARENRPDKWADGNNGYLKASFVISKMAEHGFDLVKASDVNANPADLADEGDKVWRLPPSLRGHDDNDAKRAAMLKIGESHRMTLLFRKPLVN